jgi:hypothetical protein
LREWGVALIGAGVGALFFAFIGYRVRHKWPRLDPGPRSLTTAQRFALGRQQAVMRQAPFFRRVGETLLALGIILVLINAVR